jgi:hypothetical protein
MPLSSSVELADRRGRIASQKDRRVAPVASLPTLGIDELAQLEEAAGRVAYGFKGTWRASSAGGPGITELLTSLVPLARPLGCIRSAGVLVHSSLFPNCQFHRAQPAGSMRWSGG